MKRFVILLIVVALLTLGIFAPSVKADSVLPTGTTLATPDVVTTSVIWLSQSVKPIVQNGTLGVVVWTGPNCFALDVPGGYDGVEDLVVFSRTVPFIASGVVVKLEGSSLRVYFTHTAVIVLQWNDLSVDPSVDAIYHQDLFVGRVLRVEDTGSWESETSYCGCATPVVKRSSFYKIYLVDAKEIPYDPPTGDVMVVVGVMVPDYDSEGVKGLVGDYVHISLTRGNYMYFWLPPGVG